MVFVRAPTEQGLGELAGLANVTRRELRVCLPSVLLDRVRVRPRLALLLSSRDVILFLHSLTLSFRATVPSPRFSLWDAGLRAKLNRSFVARKSVSSAFFKLPRATVSRSYLPSALSSAWRPSSSSLVLICALNQGKWGGGSTITCVPRLERDLLFRRIVVPERVVHPKSRRQQSYRGRRR